ncbi:hypothetical protein GCM10011416_02070 [Polaribacter pacificus]|uniref:MobA-like NTP transferase domain-containing protein n=1 Tax=Polaribacter pacificus TaxID=1775173 RepID=A0A917HT71_9FLAO|nr:NTP transferase domain-containing protein [Polaribacter pacificus]GGG89236.1 hypothetical protein GCM10011416_02070 [Polaribacter pacificus]
MERDTTLIILAGGKSSRMGLPKGLLKHKDSFWILSQVEGFIGETIYIGLGYDHQRYFDAIPWLQQAVEKPQLHQQKKVRVVINKTPQFGLFSTLQTILIDHQMQRADKTVLITPIDVPLPNTKNQKKIFEKDNLLVIPKYKGKNGHPVKLAPEFWCSLLNIDVKDPEARLDVQIKKRNASEISYVEINDASILKNLNSPKDWQNYLNS